MKTSSRIALTVALATAALGALSTNAFAETAWQQSHPRRAEVNGRLAAQNKRISNEVSTGRISHAQAHALRANDKTVRGEERAMATQDGGHVTRTDRRALNQQLNQNSAAIGK